MSKTKAGERLPYLLSKLKAPRVLERLEQTASLAREQKWPYERFLETLLEAEVFARDASGARMRVRAAGLSTVVLLLMTAVFDNIMIGVGLVDYAPDRISGVKIGIAPLEDFAYSVAALVLLPSVWTLLGGRRAPKEARS